MMGVLDNGGFPGVLKVTRDGVSLRVRVIPRSAQNRIQGIVGGAIRLRLAAPPVEGAANDACIRFFADLFGVPKGRVDIISGHKSRDKVVKVQGVDEQTARRVMDSLSE